MSPDERSIALKVADRATDTADCRGLLKVLGSCRIARELRRLAPRGGDRD